MEESGVTLSAAMLASVPAARGRGTGADASSDRLQDRREVTAGTRAYSVGFQDGRFYANGWHITGEMGGIWAPPLKLADGVWFGVDDQWVGAATKFTSGRGYTRYDLPAASGLKLRRIDFVPDGRRAALYGLELTNPGAAAEDGHGQGRRALRADGRLPVGLRTTSPNASDNLADTGGLRGGALVFTDKGTLPGAEPHDYATLAGSDRRPTPARPARATGARSPARSARPTTRSPPSGVRRRPVRQRRRRAAALPRHRQGRASARPCGSRVAGSDKGLGEARRELAGALRDPGRPARGRRPPRARELARRSQARPARRPPAAGGRRLGQAEHRRPHADRDRPADPLRRPGQGSTRRRSRRSRERHVRRRRLPGLPVAVRHRRRVHGVRLGRRSASSRRSRTHLLALRDISDALNARWGKVAHEIVTDGSVYFGANTDPGNTDETVKFPSAVALVWRWTGDDRFRDALYDFSRRATCSYVIDTLDEDDDGWPEGLGNVERAGMGEEKLDNTVYYVRGLYDLADMAAAKRDRGDRALGARRSRDRLRARFDAAWWDADDAPVRGLAADTATRSVQQKHWIGADADGGRADRSTAPPCPASRRPTHGAAALAERETDCYSGEPPVQPRPLPHGLRRRPDGRRRARRSSRSTPRSRPSARATTGGSAPAAAALHGRQRGADVPSPTSSRARCRRSCPSPDFDATGPTTATSTAAGPAARCSCRPGATTARPGRWSTSSSACGRRWARGAARGRPAAAAGPAARRGPHDPARRRGRSTCAPSGPAGAT